MLPKCFSYPVQLSLPKFMRKQTCCQYTSCHDHHPQIRKGTQFYPFQCHRNCKYLKNRKYKRYPRPVPWLLPSSFSVSVSADFLHRKIPAAPGSVRQLPVSAPAFHTFSPASLARIPIATFSGVIGSSLTRTPVAL